MGSAEKMYRAAFERLKLGQPDRLEKGALITQNNVAKEAGRDPSALKKNRFPELIREIQLWVEIHGGEKTKSQNQKFVAARNRNRDLKQKIAALKVQRDEALSILVHADAKILALTIENARLNSLLESTSRVTHIDKATRTKKIYD